MIRPNTLNKFRIYSKIPLWSIMSKLFKLQICKFKAIITTIIRLHRLHSHITINCQFNQLKMWKTSLSYPLTPPIGHSARKKTHITILVLHIRPNLNTFKTMMQVNLRITITNIKQITIQQVISTIIIKLGIILIMAFINQQTIILITIILTVIITTPTFRAKQ